MNRVRSFLERKSYLQNVLLGVTKNLRHSVLMKTMCVYEVDGEFASLGKLLERIFQENTMG